MKNKRVSPERVTSSMMDRYLLTLSPDIQDLYKRSYILVRDINDTLSEDFQLAARVVGVFEERALNYARNH